MADDTHLCWLDFETTGLDTTTAVPLEYSAQLTSMADPLVVLHEAEYVIHHQKLVMDNVVHKMHAESGLLDAVHDSRVEEMDAREALWLFVGAAVHTYERVLLAGSGVRYDWDLCNERWGRDVLARLHYRVVDVSVLRETAQSAGAPVYQRNRPHRARDDVNDSRAELVFYQSIMKGGRGG